MKYVKKERFILLYFLIFLLFFAGINTARAQQESVDELVQTAIENGLDKSSLDELRTRAQNRGMNEERLTSLIQSAVQLSQQDLPAEHVIQKALEGLSKGVPDGQIISVINRMNSSTAQAAKIVDPWMNNPNVQKMVERSQGAENSQQFRNRMIQASSKAISQNIPAESIDQILSEIGNESVLSRTSSSDVVSAIGVLPDLSAGDRPEVARSFVVRALKGGFKSAELQKLPMAVNMAQKRNQIPAAGILEGVSRQLQSGTPASQVLQNLFNGNIGGGPPGNLPPGLRGNKNAQGKGQGQQGQGRGNN